MMKIPVFAPRPIVVTRLLLLFALLICNAYNVQAQATAQETKLDSDDLESLTDAELELICVERGFELIQDESEVPLTHEDFVDAAKRCLAIEEDMNEILEQNPELADELLSEIDRMKEEKDQLEAERQRMLAQKETLEQQLAAGSKEEETLGGGGTRMWGAAGVDDASSPKQQSASATDDSAHSTDPDASASTDQGRGFLSPKPSDTEEEASLDDVTITEDEEEEEEAEDPCEDPNSAAAKVDDEKATDFSLKSFIQEVVAEFEKDVSRFTSLILPVVKPLFATGNKAWGYVKVMFQSAREQLKKYKEAQKEPPKGGDDILSQKK